jgi:N-acetylglucosaminyl-diphospho-decaprenol L-rhamnosyltransferase
MAISVIVSNFNGAKYLPKLLQSLKEQRDVELELIVVDRNSKDDSPRILAEHPDVRVVQEGPESGLVAGYAVGATYAKHEYLFFCNEDMWFSPDCLSLLLRQFSVEGERVGAVMPVQLSYDGSRVVNAGVWFTKSRWYRDNPFPFRASISVETHAPERISGINAGACLISRTAYDDVGGWDTTFFLDYEDMDLSLRLWQRGWDCRLEPRALVYHAVGASNTQQLGPGRSTVGRKRYVAAFSNELAIALKSFTGPAPLLVPVLVAERLARDLLKRRFDNVLLDLAAARLTLARLPKFLHHRREQRAWNRERPGQRYFSEVAFDADQAARERARASGQP